MKYGFVLPGGTATQQIEHAILADQNGWDGIFVWEAAYGVDPWTLLAAMAVRTQHIKLGTMLTPLPWRRPWKLASQVVTLDQISNGRAILAVGLGAVSTGLGNTGEELDRRVRAEMLDEGLDLIRGLWEGSRRYQGNHYNVDLEARADLSDVAKPVQDRIPIWVVAAWHRTKSMRRVLRCDGVLPNFMDANGPRQATPDGLREMVNWLHERGARPDLDVVWEGETPADGTDLAADTVRPWAEAGATWWIESRWEMPHESPERMQQVRERLLAGPPRID